GGDVARHLPAGFGNEALTLENLTMAFDATTHSVSAIDVEVHSDGPWSLPGLEKVDVRDLTLKLHAAWPGPEVTGSIGGTVDLDGPAITISASKPSGTGPWQIKGSLAKDPVDLKALAAKFGGFAVPPVLQDATLTTLDITFDTSGDFSFDGG